jgi:hypothetical protein
MRSEPPPAFFPYSPLRFDQLYPLSGSLSGITRLEHFFRSCNVKFCRTKNTISVFRTDSPKIFFISWYRAIPQDRAPCDAKLSGAMRESRYR